MVHTFRVVLKQDEGFDVHDTREFDLPLESKFAIGRASKNQSKAFLLPGKHNVFIDSPVVSREHAIFTANTSAGSPQVYITDTKSMHGTYVNGTPLVPHAPKHLFNGDKLQFGVNVNRNESYFMAYKYTFNAELSNLEPFSRGFTVPEAESEEEELDFVQSGRGSQLNPLILEDSDAEPEEEEEEEVEENSEDAMYSDVNVDVTIAHLDNEDAGEVINLAEDEDLAEDVAMDVSSDIESDDGSTDSAPEYELESPLLHDAQPIEELDVHVEVPATQVEPTLVEHSELSSGQWLPLDLSALKQTPAESFSAAFDSAATSFPLAPQVANPWLTDEATTSGRDLAPPLPPRPSQKRQRIWEEDEPAWYEDCSVMAEQVGLFNRDVLKADTDSMHASIPVAGRIQTPPHLEPTVAAFEALDRGSDTAPTDIVDAQPPTPTSINGRKRSADEAFDREAEGHTEVQDVPTLAQAALMINVREDNAIPTVEEGLHNQRPIAQPKSIFRKALRAAKVMVPATALGAVFTVTALATLPESFFTVV